MGTHRVWSSRGWVLTEYGHSPCMVLPRSVVPVRALRSTARSRLGSASSLQHANVPKTTRKRAKDNAQTCQRQRANVPKTTRKRAPKTTRKRLWGRSFGSPRPRRCYLRARAAAVRPSCALQHECRTCLDAPLCSLCRSAVRQEEDESDEDENNTFWLASVGRLAAVEPRTAARMRTLARANAQ